jgi:gas vesicle protein
MKTLNIIISIGIAAGAGLAIGWLSAPKNGKKTRSRIADDLQNYKDSLDAYTKERLREAKKIIDKNLADQHANGNLVKNKIKELVAQ